MTSLERSVTTTDRTVGLFWDLESLQIPPDVDPVVFGSELFEIARTFSSMSNIDVARAFGNSSIFTPEQKDGLWAIGFELVLSSETDNKEAIDKSLLMHILLWLWDTERQVGSMRASPCVILVTSNHDFAPLLNKLRNRSAHVVLITELTGLGRTPAKPEMRRAANVCIDWHEVVALAKQAGSTKSASSTSTAADKFPLARLALGGASLPLARSSIDHVKDYLGVAHEFLGDDAGTPTAIGPMQPVSDAQLLDDDEQQQMQTPPLTLFGSVPPSDSSLGFGATFWKPQSMQPAPISYPRETSSAVAGNLALDQRDFESRNFKPSGQYSGKGLLLADEDMNTPEHLQLADDMFLSFSTRNVKLAVSTMRKIYTKQTRTFRITSLLAQIISPPGHALTSPTGLPEQGDSAMDEIMSVTGSVSDASARLSKEQMNSPEWIEICVFALTCIQWCFGVQKGSKVESFKYKMNKNIARWILKELQRKGIPENDDLKEQAITVTNEVLQHVVELDFCLEMLELIGVDKPLQVLRPHVASWANSDHPTLSARAADFAHRYSLSASLLQERQEYDLNEALAVSEDVNDNMVVHRAMRQVLLKRWTSREHPQEELSLEDRLILLLAKNGQGVMGARIPALYRDDYGEPMRLGARRKLKDVLLSTGKVQMIGPEGPGDKLFRLRPRAKAEMEAKYELGYEHMEAQDDELLEGHEEEDFFFMSPLRPPGPPPNAPTVVPFGSFSRNLFSGFSVERPSDSESALLPPPPGFNPIITRPAAAPSINLRPRSAPQNQMDVQSSDQVFTPYHQQRRSWDATSLNAAIEAFGRADFTQNFTQPQALNPPPQSANEPNNLEQQWDYPTLAASKARQHVSPNDPANDPPRVVQP